MAKVRGRPFEKGNKAAKGVGRPWLDPNVKMMKRFTADELGQLISTLLYATDAEIDAIAANPEAPTGKKIIAKALINARDHGTWSTLNSILDRLIGKVKDVVEHQGLRPSILKRTDGTSVEFSLEKVREEE